jgi:predicted nucleic acid-binding protein
VAEPGSDSVREAMAKAEAWFICRVGFVETARAVALVAGRAAERRFRAEWPTFGVVEVDQRLVEAATGLAQASGLRSLDALHLASALLLPQEDLAFATWDRRLRTAAAKQRLALVPEALP